MIFTEATMQMAAQSHVAGITEDPTLTLRASGFSPLTKKLSAINEARLDQTFDVWNDFKEGKLHPYMMLQAFNPSDQDMYSSLCKRYPYVFSESITTADFDFLTDNMLNRTLLAAEIPQDTTWHRLVKVNDQVRDFRQLTRNLVDGGMGVWDQVGEREGFNRGSVTADKKYYTVSKYEKGFEFSWESVINDDLSALTDLPGRLLKGGDMTIEKAVTEMYVDANGPHASFFTSGNGNILQGNPPLSQEALEAAIAHFLDYEDVDGTPITVSGATLVVSTGAMLVKATNWKNTLITTMSTSMGSSTRQMEVRNWLAEKFDIVYNPWIGKTAVTSNGPTTWFIFANPSVGRPAIEVGFLKGFRRPTLYRRRSNTVAMGGGEAAGLGDYETMATGYKGLVVFGGATMYAKSALASNGSGS
jgi:hypothetical protein